MKITAAVSIVPVRVEMDVPDSTPPAEIRDRVIEQARHQIANNGSEHVILAASMPTLVDPISDLADLGFPILTEHVQVDPPEPDWHALAEYGVCRQHVPSPYSD